MTAKRAALPSCLLPFSDATFEQLGVQPLPPLQQAGFDSKTFSAKALLFFKVAEGAPSIVGALASLHTSGEGGVVSPT